MFFKLGALDMLGHILVCVLIFAIRLPPLTCDIYFILIPDLLQAEENIDALCRQRAKPRAGSGLIF